jgi:hypothetical protein
MTKGNKVFPTFAVIVLILAVLWMLSGFKVFTADIPWIPIIVVVIAVGWIVNHYTKKK